MKLNVIWEAEATNAAARFLKDDQDGLRQVCAAVGLLAHELRPVGGAELGSQFMRRIHVGGYRVIYEIFESKLTIVVMCPGRVG